MPLSIVGLPGVTKPQSWLDQLAPGVSQLLLVSGNMHLSLTA